MSKRAPPDARRFRDTFGLFATGVAVIVARAGEEAIAMTVNAVSSLSLEPMLAMFCPGRTSRFAQHVADISGFSINFLRDEQQALSTFFAGGWQEAAPPPFRFVPSRSAMRLEGSLASIDCERVQLLEMGDHWMVVGQVVDVHIGIAPHRPLLFFKGQYRGVDFSESTPAPDIANVRDEPFHIFYDGWD
ncbi:MAG TPA: flavin reductase family protein [Steroidobacteraceae bacterium]